jgi:hypothetical protein
MGFLATPEEIIVSAQIFSVIHGAIWVQKHWFSSDRHKAIREHHYDGHQGSPFACEADKCATL